jgi:hypothetical protein
VTTATQSSRSLRNMPGQVGHRVADELANQSIVNSIDAQLSAKGLMKVSPGEEPHVMVSPRRCFRSRHSPHRV